MRRRALDRFLSYARREARIYAVAFVAVVATNAVDVGLTWAIGAAIGEVEAGAGADRALGWTAAIVVGASALFLLQGTMRNLVFWAGRRVERNVRADLARKILRLPAAVRDRYRIGDLASRLVNDVSDIRMFVGAGFLQVANTLFAFLFSVALMFRLDARLAAWSLVPFGLSIVLSRRLTRATHDRSLEAQEALGRLSDRAHEGIAGIEVVKAYAVEAWRGRVLDAAGEAYLRANLRLARAEAFLAGAMSIGVPLGVVVVLFVGGADRIAGRLSTGHLVAFVLLFMRLAWPAVALGWVTNVLQRGLAAMGRVLDVLDAPERAALRPPPRRRGPPPPAPALAVRGLTFGYAGGPAVLRGIDLDVRPGEHLGIAGPTASGKSTLLAVLALEYDPPAGTVLLDGTDVLAWDLEDLRRAIALSSQRPHLFSMRLEENIRLARPEADHGAVEEAIRAAALETDVVEFPEGLKTPVGERGITLSGGQRARAAIARALLADPAVLLLDDPCAAVDLGTEAVLRERVRRARAGRTTVIASQRLSTLTTCDRIAVVVHGRVAEEGTHEALVRRGGWYAAAWEAETLRRELSA